MKKAGVRRVFPNSHPTRTSRAASIHPPGRRRGESTGNGRTLLPNSISTLLTNPSLLKGLGFQSPFEVFHAKPSGCFLRRSVPTDTLNPTWWEPTQAPSRPRGRGDVVHMSRRLTLYPVSGPTRSILGVWGQNPQAVARYQVIGSLADPPNGRVALRVLMRPLRHFPQAGVSAR
jgi:hypothetical protein